MHTCPYNNQCPQYQASDREAACIATAHPEQGWNLLCNGVIMFDDTGELLPNGTVVEPCRNECLPQ